MKITLKELSMGDVQCLFLRSFENGIYLTEVELAGGRYTVCDGIGQPLKFRSQLEAKKPFKGLGIQHTHLVQLSPYNEMIGMPADRVEALEVKLLNPDQDYS